MKKRTKENMYKKDENLMSFTFYCCGGVKQVYLEIGRILTAYTWRVQSIRIIQVVSSGYEIFYTIKQ